MKLRLQSLSDGINSPGKKNNFQFVSAVESYLACNRGCFLLVNLIDTGIPEVKEVVRGKVKPYIKTVKSQDTPGAKLLLSKLE